MRKPFRIAFREIEAAGVTDFGAAIYDLEAGAFDRTLSLLNSLK